MKLKSLFTKRAWAMAYEIDDQNRGSLECEGNLFQFIIAVLKTMR